MKQRTLKSIAIAAGIALGMAAFAQDPPPPPPVGSGVAQGVGGVGGPGGPGGQGGGQGGPGGFRGQQGPGMGMRPPMDGPAILMNPRVQQELHLTTEQTHRLRETFGMRQGQGGLGGPGGPGGQEGGFGGPGGPGGQGGPGGGPGGPGGPPPGGQGGFGGGPGGQGGGPGGPPPGGFGGPGGGPGGQGGPGGPGMGGQGMGGPGGQSDARRAADEKKLKGILDEKQFARYMQLSLQAEGPRAFMRADVVKKLGLTEDQTESIRGILEKNRPRPQMGQGGPGGPGGPGGQGGPGGPGGEGMQPPPPSEDMRKQVMEKITAVFTSEQREKWHSMVGPAFDLRPPRREDD